MSVSFGFHRTVSPFGQATMSFSINGEEQQIPTGYHVNHVLFFPGVAVSAGMGHNPFLAHERLANDPFMSQLMQQFLELRAQGLHNEDDFQRILLLSQNDRHGPPPASSNAIKRLHRFKAEKGDKNTDVNECVVCMEEFHEGEELVSMPCKHVFHETCLSPWLQQHNTCPTCRVTVEASTDPLPSQQDTHGQRDGDNLLDVITSAATTAATSAWNWLFPNQSVGRANERIVVEEDGYENDFRMMNDYLNSYHNHREDADYNHILELSRNEEDQRQRTRRQYPTINGPHLLSAPLDVDNEALAAMASAMTVQELKAEIQAAGGSVEGCLYKEDLVRMYAQYVLAEQGGYATHSPSNDPQPMSEYRYVSSSSEGINPPNDTHDHFLQPSQSTYPSFHPQSVARSSPVVLPSSPSSANSLYPSFHEMDDNSMDTNITTTPHTNMQPQAHSQVISEGVQDRTTPNQLEIMIQLPNGQSILQYFSPYDTPNEILLSVERLSGFKRCLHVLHYTGSLAGQPRLQHERTLHEQGITNRTRLVLHRMY